MDGNSNKNLLLVGLIIFVVLVAAGITGVWIKYKGQEPSLGIDISSAAVKAKCIEDVDRMSDEQIIEKVNTLAFVTEEELKEVKISMKNYLICRLGNERKEFDKRIMTELYNRTAKLIQQLTIPEEQKDYTLTGLGNMLYEVEDGERVRLLGELFINAVALKPMGVICPDGDEEKEFLEKCLGGGRTAPKNINKLSPEEIEESSYHCNHMCDYLIQYTEDPSKFEADMVNFDWFSDLELLSSQFSVRAAIAFRAGDKELALKLCDSIPNPNLEIKENCRNYANSLEYINCKNFGFDESRNCEQKTYEECNGLYEKVKNLICEIETRK